MDDIYFTLPCNVTCDYHKNSLGDYITPLPHTVELDGQWEVALVELTFNKSWYNIWSEQQVGIQLEDLTFKRYVKEDTISPGRYTDVELVRRVNQLLAVHANETMPGKDAKTGEPLLIRKPIESLSNMRITQAPRIQLNSLTRKVTISIGKDTDGCNIMPVLGEEITSLLGFEAKDLELKSIVVDKNGEKQLVASRAFDFEAGIYAIYVYSDIVKPNYVGDKSVQCLRVCSIPSDKKFGDTCTIAYSNPCYYPLSSKRFKDIRITLKDKTNTEIPFKFGETFVKLHLRRKNAL